MHLPSTIGDGIGIPGAIACHVVRSSGKIVKICVCWLILIRILLENKQDLSHSAILHVAGH
jgi:hypothetical protein